MGQKISKIKRRKFGVRGRESVIDDRESEINDRNSNVEDRNPEVEGHNPNVEGRNPDVEDRNPDIGGRNPEVEGRESEVKDRNPEVEDHDPEVEDRNLDVEGRKYERLLFVSLGMIALDDIEYPEKSKQSVLGGEGLWATFGARLFKPRRLSKEVGCLVVSRRDYPYPDELYETLVSWDVTAVAHECYNRPVNRTHVKYGNQRYFWRTLSYHEPPFKPMVGSLRGTVLFTAASFHLSCGFAEVRRQIRSINGLRLRYGIRESALIVWQPAYVKAASRDPEDPEEMGFEEYLKSYLEVLPQVDVFSLSYQELKDIVGGLGTPMPSDDWDARKNVEELSERIPQASLGYQGNGLMIVRCEPIGYFYRIRNEKGWVKGYSQYYILESIVDFTGAGSAFLGAFTIAFLVSGNVEDSCKHGAVAASFAMEQFGLPVMTQRHPLLEENPYDGEHWNSERAFQRLRLLRGDR
ncbi:hypothetical protein F5B21DRAFT_398684 [Xylaria acuta]|nr:hypothetical protein F5B21DRAFT_398684 [Xylaria acuta]